MGGVAAGLAAIPPNVPSIKTLKQQLLPLKLNLNVQEILQDGIDIDDVDEDNEEDIDADADHMVENEDINLQTVTLVPQLRTKIITTTTTTTTTTSLPRTTTTPSSALAKFNRLIDTTMVREDTEHDLNATSDTDAARFNSSMLQERLSMAYPELVSLGTPSDSKLINNLSRVTQDHHHHYQQQQQQQQQHQHHLDHHYCGSKVVETNFGTPLTFPAPSTTNQQQQQPQATTPEMMLEKIIVTQKNNLIDHHHHFIHNLDDDIYDDDDDDDDDADDNDVEDVNQMKRNDVHYLLKQLNSFSDIEEIEIVDMKQSKQQLQLQLQRQQQQQQKQKQHQRHQQQQPPQTSSSLSPTHSHKQQIQRQRQRHQFASLSASGDGSIQMTPQFDDYLFESSHYLETANTKNYCTAMIERSSSHEFRHLSINSRGSSSNSFHLNDMELPSVACKAAAPPPTSPPPQPHLAIAFQPIPLQVETRLTTSGVQTELTAESLNKLSQSSSDSNGSDQRGLPFFRCCYTPIDRWRERRQQKSSTSTTTTNQKNDKNGCHHV